MKPKKVACVITVLATFVYCATALGASTASAYRAPGWGDLLYEVPDPGTYELPPIMPAVDGEVLRSDYTSARLYDLMENRIVFLSFIFTRCSDINGCPLANAVLYKVKSRLNQQPELAKQVALLTISFDPEFDTPEVTGTFESAYSEGEIDWEFLTTRDQAALQPILDGYGQFAVQVREHHDHGDTTTDYIHLLRVYLIDRSRQIRNIYSVSFLHPDILLNDLQTLLLEN